MKILKNILDQVGIIEVIGTLERNIKSVCFDSRDITTGDLFIAVRGTRTDGHKYLEEAIKTGASAVVCEEYPTSISDESTYILVKNSARALAEISSNFFDRPSGKLRLIGITGTNGKTTIATLLYRLVIEMGYPAALLSTIETRINDKVLESTHTTPDPHK